MVSYYKGIENNTNPTWWKDPGLRKNALWVSLSALIYGVKGYDSGMFNNIQAIPKFFEQFPMLKSNPTLLGTVTAVMYLPGLFFPFFGAWLADRIGRKIPLVIALTGAVVTPIIQAFSHSLGQMMAGRFLMGMFSSLGMVSGLAMCAELSHPRWRAQAASLQLSAYYVGNILCSCTSYATINHIITSEWAWRLPVLLQLILPLIALPMAVWIPQSPRWLIAQGRIDEARQIFATLHANGKMDDPLVEMEMTEVQNAIEYEREHSVRWRDLISTKANRRRVFIVIHAGAGAQLNGIGIIAYYLVTMLKLIGVTDSRKQSQLIIGMGVMNLCINTIMSCVVDRLGRRPMWISSTLVMLISISSIMGLSATFEHNKSNAIANATIFFIFLFYVGFDLGWMPLGTPYASEVLPFSLRAKGLAVSTFSTYASLCLNTWVNPIAMSRIGWKYYSVYIVVCVYLLVIAFFCFPETKGRTLEEVAYVFNDYEEGALDRHSSGKKDLEIEHDNVAPTAEKTKV